jgi:hypothetical protein
MGNNSYLIEGSPFLGLTATGILPVLICYFMNILSSIDFIDSIVLLLILRSALYELFL